MMVSDVFFATKKMAIKAVENSYKAYMLSWRYLKVESRLAYFEMLVDLVQRDMCELAVLQTIEVTKPWIAVDADVA